MFKWFFITVLSRLQIQIAQSVYRGDYACHWRRNMKREWRQAVRQRHFHASSGPPGAHTCMTQPKLWGRAQGRPAPATLSSTLWFEIRRQDADTQKSTSGGLCLCLCDHECRPRTDVKFRRGKKRKRNFISCSSDITRHWENKMLSSKKYHPGDCVFSGSKWENMLTKSGP